MSNYVNDFSWSYSRHTTFQTCLKKYYFSYYAAWGGWQENAAARTREIYRLKRLFTRQQWAGHHAHQAIGALLKNIPRRTDDSFAASVEARQIERMRREFRDSRSGAYRANPARIPGLFEHEYNLELPAEEWKAQALLSGRDYVAPDDVQAILPQTIAHRLTAISSAGRSSIAQVQAMVQAIPLS